MLPLQTAEKDGKHLTARISADLLRFDKAALTVAARKTRASTPPRRSSAASAASWSTSWDYCSTASVSDRTAGMQLLAGVAATHPTISRTWADTAYRTKAIDHAATLGIDLKPSAATPPPKDSCRYRDAEWWSARSAG
ncbi:hypothetical protein [Actinomadura montaniterrae]|uniref:Transposase n=1 Tax=Actinomadura montaniterrae TaxID=1803903 RepID=A0A6L3W6C4_9ACTN|nr:hypothetical protein [Actinomadura montaniterrae]KAB2385945.1 hypothetical protein F9B16_09090 [Actinomadura montaniterrae]